MLCKRTIAYFLERKISVPSTEKGIYYEVFFSSFNEVQQSLSLLEEGHYLFINAINPFPSHICSKLVSSLHLLDSNNIYWQLLAYQCSPLYKLFNLDYNSDWYLHLYSKDDK